MAKIGNKSGTTHIDMNGPCVDCGEKKGPFVSVRRCTTRKSLMVKLCEKCKVQV